MLGHRAPQYCGCRGTVQTSDPAKGRVKQVGVQQVLLRFEWGDKNQRRFPQSFWNFLQKWEKCEVEGSFIAVGLWMEIGRNVDAA